MHLVVVRRVPVPLEQAIPILAGALGGDLYTARTRLAGELPRVVASLGDREEAAALLRALGGAGFEAVSLDSTAIETDRDRRVCARLALEPNALVATLRDGDRAEVPWRSIRLIIHGTRTSTHLKAGSGKSDGGEALRKVTGLATRVLTGGLMGGRKQPKTAAKPVVVEDREQFLHILVHEGEGPPLAIHEHRMDYGFLGKALQPASSANFAALLAELRKRAPSARLDARLLKPPAMPMIPSPPPGIDPGQWKVDLAEAVLRAGL